MRHNNALPNAHFHKHWQRRVKTWFDQPGRKVARREARAKKAAVLAPRPLSGALRPAVRCPTVKYNRRLRVGRGFSLDELRAAGICRKLAPTIGIAVDHRRKNRSVESLERNVERLKLYRAKLVLLPNVKKDASIKKQRVLHKRKTLLAVPTVTDLRSAIPIASSKGKLETREITQADRDFCAFVALRKARTLARYHHARLKRAQAKADAAAEASSGKK